MYNNDPSNITVHYRLYRHNGQNHVICVQNFDYADYDETQFINDEYYLWENEAERALLIMENPDQYIPQLWETHYRIIEADNNLTVIEITHQQDYEDKYNSVQFYNDTFYRTADEAEDVLYWEQPTR